MSPSAENATGEKSGVSTSPPPKAVFSEYTPARGYCKFIIMLQKMLPTGIVYNTEKILRCTVEENHRRFFELTEFRYLSVLLLKHKLITDAEYSTLAGKDSHRSGDERARYFYLEVLRTKGRKAYTLLWQCLSLEKEHMGHVDLFQTLNAAVEEQEEDDDDEF